MRSRKSEQAVIAKQPLPVNQQAGHTRREVIQMSGKRPGLNDPVLRAPV